METIRTPEEDLSPFITALRGYARGAYFKRSVAKTVMETSMDDEKARLMKTTYMEHQLEFLVLKDLIKNPRQDINRSLIERLIELDGYHSLLRSEKSSLFATCKMRIKEIMEQFPSYETPSRQAIRAVVPSPNKEFPSAEAAPEPHAYYSEEELRSVFNGHFLIAKKRAEEGRRAAKIWSSRTGEKSEKLALYYSKSSRQSGVEASILEDLAKNPRHLENQRDFENLRVKICLALTELSDYMEIDPEEGEWIMKTTLNVIKGIMSDSSLEMGIRINFETLAKGLIVSTQREILQIRLEGGLLEKQGLIYDDYRVSSNLGRVLDEDVHELDIDIEGDSMADNVLTENSGIFKLASLEEPNVPASQSGIYFDPNYSGILATENPTLVARPHASTVPHTRTRTVEKI